VTSAVILVDDHDLIREGLRRAFEREPDFTVAGEAATVEEATALAAETGPDVVVIDVNLPDGSGLELVRALRAGSATLGIVVLTMYDDDATLFAALDAGASSLVTKTATTEQVLSAARHALAAPGTFSAMDLAGAMRRRMASNTPRLSQRESDVLVLLGEGLPIGVIAKRLFVSESTVKSHVSKLYEKLGASNRSQALLAAIRNGLIDAG
jgi:DNA-binding NarL/FixJ family response regulator